MQIEGRVWIFGDEINTDLIFPHHALGLAPKEQCLLCMADNRPGWAEQVQPGDILVAGKNFGTGSSRPGAAILKRLGLAGMIAESFNGLFYRNCIGYGFAAMTVPDCLSIFSEGDIAEINYLAGTVKNKTTGQEIAGRPLSPEMVENIQAGGIEGALIKKGFIPAK